MEPTSLGLRPGPNDIGALQPDYKAKLRGAGTAGTGRHADQAVSRARNAVRAARTYSLARESHARAAAQWCCPMFSLCSASSWRPSSPP
jgi:hypothetical protein